MAKEKIVRDRNSYFGVAPLWMYEAGISLQAIATFSYIQGRYGGSKLGIFPKHETLAAALKVSERSVRNYLTELIQARAIRVTRRGFNKSNWYELASDGPLLEDSSVDDEKNDGSSGVGGSNS